MGLGLIIGVWVARYLGPEQFGLFNFATAFVGLFGAIAGLGLQDIVVRDIVCDPSGKEETLGTAAVLQFAGGLIAYGLILVTIFWLRSDDTLAKVIVAILGSMTLFKASEVAVYWFESQVLSKFTVWVQNGVFFVFAAIKVLLLLQRAPLVAFAWATMSEALIVALLMLMMLSLRGLRVGQLRMTVARAKLLLVDSWPMLLSGVAVLIYMKVDQVMLGQMVGDDAVGVYSAAVRISEVWYFAPMAVVASVFPAILESKKRSEEQYLRRLQFLYDILVWLSVAVALVINFLSTHIIYFLFGSAYGESSSVLTCHIWTGVFVSMGVARGKWMLAENLQYMGYWYVGLGMIMNVVCNYLLIPNFGIRGAAFATLVSQAVVAIGAPLLFSKTRLSALMLILSMNPFGCYFRLKTAFVVSYNRWSKS